MPEKNADLHGSAPDESPVVLVLIDLINDLEFEGAEALLERALLVTERIAVLKQRARDAGIPVVYANDNFGKWRSDFREVIAHCLENGVRGKPIVQLVEPDEDDYFVLKPKHSAFFATTFETLLDYFGAKRLILTGISGDICVLFTANDAHMRDYRLHVPSDCVVSISEKANDQALAYMRRVLGADTTPSAELDLENMNDPAAPQT